MPAPVVTALGVCYAPAMRRFVVRYTARWPSPTGEMMTGTTRYPVTRRQLIRDSGGPELGDFLMAHPGLFWRMPLPVGAEEDHAL